MQRRFYNRRATNTVAKVLPPAETGLSRYNPVHRILNSEDEGLNTVLLLLAVSQLTKDRNDMPLPQALEHISPYLDGPQQLQVNSIVNLSRMSNSLNKMKRSGTDRSSRDPRKNAELIRALSDVVSSPSKPLLKNIGDVYERGETMNRSIKQMQTLRSRKGKAPIGDMIDAMSSIMPNSPLSNMGGVIKAAQMMGNMGGMGSILGNFNNKGSGPVKKTKPIDDDDIFADDDLYDDDDGENEE